MKVPHCPEWLQTVALVLSVLALIITPQVVYDDLVAGGASQTTIDQILAALGL